VFAEITKITRCNYYVHTFTIYIKKEGFMNLKKLVPLEHAYNLYEVKIYFILL